jgi:hypothetical protein
VETEVPGGVPWVFPLVGHRDNVVVDHVEPLAIPKGEAAAMERVGTVVLQPRVGVPVVILLGPEHAGDGLAHHLWKAPVKHLLVTGDKRDLFAVLDRNTTVAVQL